MSIFQLPFNPVDISDVAAGAAAEHRITAALHFHPRITHNHLKLFLCLILCTQTAYLLTEHSLRKDNYTWACRSQRL